MGGVQIQCLLDSGSEVSTITESCFNKYFRPKGSTFLSACGWLTLKAANGLSISYVGYFELDVKALGITVPKRGMLVVKDHEDPTSRRSMNNLRSVTVSGALSYKNCLKVIVKQLFLFSVDYKTTNH